MSLLVSLVQPNPQSSHQEGNQPAAQNVERVVHPRVYSAVAAQQRDTEDEQGQRPAPSDLRGEEKEEQQRTGQVVDGMVRRTAVSATPIVSSISFLQQMHLICPMILFIMRRAYPLHSGFEDTRSDGIAQKGDRSNEQQDFPRLFPIQPDRQQ